MSQTTNRTPIAASATFLTQAIALSLAASGGASIAGWALDVPVALQPLATGAAMPLIAACAVAASAAAFYLLHRAKAVARRADMRRDAERASSEAALRWLSTRHSRNLRRLRALTDTVPALLGYIDRNERYRFANQHYQELLGVQPEDLLDCRLRDVVGADTYRELEPHVRQALGGMPADFHCEAVVGGAMRQLRICYLPDYDQSGEVRGFYTMTQDVSAQRRIEEALALSERGMRTITDNLPAQISYVDAEQRYRFANRKCEERFGLARGDIEGKKVSELLGRAAYAKAKEHIASALQGLPTTFEHRSDAGGRERHLLSSYIPDVDAQGKVIGYFAMTQDMTARKDAEIARATSEERLRTVTDNLPVVIAYIDPARRFQFANRTWEQWLNLPRADIVGHRLNAVLGDAMGAKLEPFIAAALGGEQADFEVELAFHDTVRHVRGNFIPHFDEELHVLGVYGMINDITVLKTAEAKLIQMARFDGLTGLPNRGLLNERIENALARARRERSVTSLLFLDIDRFKHINDSWGHAAGDAVLKEFAARLTSCVRATDTVARLAGDEFVILLDGLHHADEAQFVARKIVAAMQREFHVEGRTLRATTSIGITACSNGDSDPDLLLKRADEALYQAKNNGRNTWKLAS